MNGKMLAALIVTLMLSLVAAPSASAAETESDCPICDFDMATYSGPLDEAEIGGLLLALNDEYLAWATYDQVMTDLGDVRPFSNIRGAEATHIQALAQVMAAYDVPVPANPWPGNVASFDSKTNACAAGVAAEIANRDLYTEIFDTTDREDISTVYRSLQRASEDNHLPAFERCADDDSARGARGQRGRGNGNSEPRPGGRGQGSGQHEPGNGGSRNRP